MISYDRHAVGNGDGSKIGAGREGFVSYACHAVGYGDRVQAGAARESIAFYFRNLIRNNKVFYFRPVYIYVISIGDRV
jgi:hypothetical protein